MQDQIQRKLTTILAADAEGYSRAMAVNEEGTLSSLRAARSVFSKLIERHSGRIANTAGDGLIAEFPSVVEAVRCAIEVQQELGAAEDDPASAMRFRIGIHLGDVIVDGDDLLGEGVNLAARLQSMAEPGGVLVSRQVYDQVHAKLSVGFDYLGERRPKNFTEDVGVFQVVHGLPGPKPKRRPRVQTASVDPDPIPQTDPLPTVTSTKAFRVFGLIAVGLIAIDIATGGGLWVQWPLLGLAMLFGLSNAQILAGPNRPVWIIQGGVIAVSMVLINLLSWNGTPWALWPVGAIGLLMLARFILTRPE